MRHLLDNIKAIQKTHASLSSQACNSNKLLLQQSKTLLVLMAAEMDKQCCGT